MEGQECACVVSPTPFPNLRVVFVRRNKVYVARVSRARPCVIIIVIIYSRVLRQTRFARVLFTVEFLAPSPSARTVIIIIIIVFSTCQTTDRRTSRRLPRYARRTSGLMSVTREPPWLRARRAPELAHSNESQTPPDSCKVRARQKRSTHVRKVSGFN